MTFKDTIAQITDPASDASNSILTDGQFSCRYRELPAFFAKLDRYFEEKNIVAGNVLSVECFNSLHSALTLLYLLNRGQSFMLLPSQQLSKKGLDTAPAPQFCSHRLTVNQAPEADSIEDCSPEEFLDCQENERRSEEIVEAVRTNEDFHGRMYIRTSGSMGAAKIVVHSQDKAHANALNCVVKYKFNAEDRVVIPIPIFHLYGFGAVFLPAVIAGASVDLQNNTNLVKFLTREKAFNPNIAFFTPLLCSLLLPMTKRRPRNYKVAVTSGQRINEDLFREFDASIGNCLINQYGSSEMGAISACVPEDSADERATTLGTPFQDVELRIDIEPSADDSEDSNQTKDTEAVGHLMCKHPHGFDGYLDDAGQWIRQATPGDWWKTGDLAKQNEAGHIVIMGRSDDRINRSGFLVLLSDIAKALEAMDDIAEAVVIVDTKESRKGQKILAFCLPSAGVETTAENIRKKCFSCLPTYAIPDELFIIHSFPKLPSGKVDIRALRNH